MPATERVARLFAGKARSYRGFHRGRNDDHSPFCASGKSRNGVLNQPLRSVIREAELPSVRPQAEPGSEMCIR